MVRGTTTSSASLFLACRLRAVAELAAGRPKPVALSAVLGDQDFERVEIEEDVARAFELGLEPCLFAVELDQEHRLRLVWDRQAGFGAHDSDRFFVEELDARGQLALRQKRGHDRRDLVQARETGERGHGGLGFRDQSERGFGDDAEGALAAHHQGGEVVAGDALLGFAPELEDRAVGEHDVHPHRVLARDAVLERARPPGVGREVAANRAGIERVRIRWKEELLLFGDSLELPSDHSGLYVRGQLLFIDALDRVHLFECQHDSARHRHRSPDAAGATASRRDRNLVLVRGLHDRRDVRRARGAYHRLGHARFDLALILRVPFEQARVSNHRAAPARALYCDQGAIE